MTPLAICTTIFRPQGVLLTLAALLAFSSLTRTQPSDRVSRVVANPVQQKEPLTIQADLINPAVVERVALAYRQFGQRDYKKLEMAVTGNTASATIPGSEVVPPFIEYYVLVFSEGSADSATYPPINPEIQPLKAEVREATISNDLIAVISPEENERLKSDDVLISFIVRMDSLVDATATHIKVDGNDVSKHLVENGSLFTLRPENAGLTLSGGSHSIQVEIYARDGKELGNYTWTFSVLGGVQAFAGTSAGWLYSSSVQLETRNESIGSETTPYNRATVAGSGTYGEYRVNGKIHITNEEKDSRQPQHRFFLGAESPWLKLGVGDAYPVFPDLIMTGRRVRGFTGNLTLGVFGLDVASGQLLRQIEGDTIKTFGGGTYSRNLLVIHPRFGKKENSYLGFTLLKSKDDISSIRYGVKPQENLVLGTDFALSFLHRTVEITGQAAASATNKDITNGTFSDADIDSVFKEYSESNRNNIRKARDILSRFITVNEHLIPLAAKNLPTLSYQGAVALNISDNAFTFTYLRHGNSFESFGQSVIRPDVVGYSVSDRVRLVQNTLFLSGGFERLQDNTAETKATTTTSTTANADISYSSHTDFPSMSVGYIHAANMNDYPIDSLSQKYSRVKTDDQTNRVFVQLSRPFEYYGRHHATFSVSTSSRDDRTPRNFDMRSTSVSLGAISAYTIPLQTFVNLSVISNSYIAVDSVRQDTVFRRDVATAYTMLSLHGEYHLAEDRVRITGTLSPMFGDVDLRRTLVGGGLQYFFTKKVSALTELNLYLNGNRDNDIIWSLILRVDV
ncbi:MAG: hypothetical protein HY033_10610 [Ignavibacteriae bacterium]|nr:hypothetical protein [Ignavibacteria bacterium]MBI3365349.1 hypothetical protein [Ignavibacteriota bacterium]